MSTVTETAAQPGDGWERGFAELTRYVEEHGTAHVPFRYTVPGAGYLLGPWVCRQRTSYRLGKLSSEHVERLEGLPSWTWQNPHRVACDAAWERRLVELRRYVLRNGDAAIERRPIGELGRWVGWQRTAYRRGKLSPERIARLEALPGWKWCRSADDRWECGFSALLRYVAAHGTADVPQSYVVPETGYRLGQWARVQRSNYRGEKLPPLRAARLEALPGWRWGKSRRRPS